METPLDNESAGDGGGSEAARSAPAGLSVAVSVDGLDGEPAAGICQFVGELVRRLSRGLDLSSLERVIVTANYVRTLQDIDRGFQATTVLTATSEEFATGVAMVVPVKRGDDFRTVLVVDAGVAAGLYADDETTRTRVVGTLLHEFAHVHDFSVRAAAMPKFMFTPLPDNLQGWLYGATNVVWSEYFACYLSAAADPAVLDDYLCIFLKSLDAFPEATRRQIVAYRTHADLGRLMSETTDRLGLLFKFASYVIGHLEGIGCTIQEARPNAWATIEAKGFAGIWALLTDALQSMHDAYPNWSDIEAYDGLGMAFRAYLKERGIELTAEGNEIRANIPLTRDTIPPEAVPLFDLHQSIWRWTT